jgi:hypothetical protein
MSGHTFAEGAERCTDCGTLKTQYELAPDKNPCPRQGITPPPRAIPQSIVNDDVSGRLAELRAAREAGWNVVKE